MTVDPLEIEDTSDWLGCPTELETCRYFLRVTENEVQELTLQLRKAREDIFGLVQMHDDVSKERDQLRAKLNSLSKEHSELSSKVYSLQRIADQRDYLFRENQRLLMEKQERHLHATNQRTASARHIPTARIGG
ncbi:hypothetical protein [Pseudomonas mandelii]